MAISNSLAPLLGWDTVWAAGGVLTAARDTTPLRRAFRAGY